MINKIISEYKKYPLTYTLIFSIVGIMFISGYILYFFNNTIDEANHNMENKLHFEHSSK